MNDINSFIENDIDEEKLRHESLSSDEDSKFQINEGFCKPIKKNHKDLHRQ